MDPMGRAIADYWNARSSESRQARLDGRVAIEMDEVNKKMDPMGRAIAEYWKTKKADRPKVSIMIIWQE